MEDKQIRRNLYRVLRKTGVKKQDIQPEASYREDLHFDKIDWTIFTYYLEGVFNIAIKDEDLTNLKNVNNTIVFLGNTA